jgi:cell wall assembly regulator SMI1
VFPQTANQSNVEAGVNELWNRLQTWLEQNAPELLETMQPGASETQIAALEKHLGVRLPDDYRAFLQLCNGQVEGAEFGFYDGELLSVDTVKFQWDVWKKLLDQGTFEESRAAPHPGIKNDWWNARWIPFTHDGGGNNLCLDLDPAKGGTVGQVITMWHDSSERELMFPSFTVWLESVLDGLESGEIVFDAKEYNALMDWGDLS